MSNNRDRILLDAVATVHGHGFAETIGDLSVHPYGYTMAVVSPVILRNVGDDDGARALESIGLDRETTVIVKDRDSGSRDIFKVGAEPLVSAAFDTLDAQHVRDFPDDDTTGPDNYTGGRVK